jgi:signal transduction histidine kinase
MRQVQTQGPQADFRAKILLVDDTPANLIALEAALEALDAEVMQASSGIDALRLLLSHDFAAIVLDVKMPGMDGFETASLIRERPRSRHTPIIFLTGFKDEEHLFRAWGIGAVDLLFKPVPPEVLRSKISVFIELARKATILERLAGEIRELNVSLEAEVEKRTAELRAAQQAAQEASEAKSRFLANMSHELRTPLNAVIGYAEMLEEEAAEKEVQSFIPDLRKIRGAARHLLALINDILDLSKIEAGKMSVEPEIFDVRALIDEVVHAVQPAVEKNQNTLVVNCPAGELRMRSDQTKIRQCLLNLLSNAAKFTRSGQIAVNVEVEDERIVFCVSDTGPGMSPEQTGRLFAPFTQVHNARRNEGTGLGLAITRALCDLLEGKVRVESETGKGSTFTLSFPPGMAQAAH